MKTKKAEKDQRPSRCQSCGAGDFTLLSSGKYRCNYCGTNQLPSAIKVYTLETSDSLHSPAAIIKRYVCHIIAGTAFLGAGTYVAASYEYQKSAVETAQQALNEWNLQKQRSVMIINRNKSLLEKRFRISLKSKTLPELVEFLETQNLPETLRISDELNGSMNREIVAMRRYGEALSRYRAQKNWVSDLFNLGHDLPEIDPNVRLKTGR
ncbi:MAG: hypothetical protein ACOY5B_03765 [Spirochaetota bacterium]